MKSSYLIFFLFLIFIPIFSYSTSYNSFDGDEIKVDSVRIDTTEKKITVFCDKEITYSPMRENFVKDIYTEMKKKYGDKHRDYLLSVQAMGYPIEELIPNYFRNDSTEFDTSRMPREVLRPSPVVENLDRKYIPENGLQNRNIVVRPSHGWYYSNDKGRWEWQRPRLFQSVEDLIPLSFTVPYLLPMLENAGAVVFDSRERDKQKYSVVVDNDSPKDIKLKYYAEKSANKKHYWLKRKNAGFAVGNPPYPTDYNPFEKGSYKTVRSDKVESASITWTPKIPDAGDYGVYISYHASDKNITDAHYIVYHSGIATEFKVNQQIGGGTWIYLGNFKFNKGYNPITDKIILINRSDDPDVLSGKKDKFITADAVRFGGGMGLIERNGETSGRRKIFEGARYYMQYAGMPDSLVYSLNKDKDDYKDDYQCRSEYVNYLYGKPFGPNRDRDAKGLGIPIDLTLSFHTDAGITHNDTTVGTLAIYTIDDAKNKPVFPDGMSRLANRDLADIIQTQLVNDIRSKYDPSWSRRRLYESNYSESTNPNVPSVLIELLSHQNFLDMKFVHDPQFRFDVARAFYKGMLRFIACQNRFKYVVQPLPITQFSTLADGSGNVKLNWQPVEDPLEPTAKPDGYIVYTRLNGGSFDNGILVKDNYYEFKKLKPGVIYSFKVTAVNNGGESFPSEILSVCKMENKFKPILIVNCFTRVAGPEYIEQPKFTGFLNEKDPGIADKYDLSFTGEEFDFNPKHEWETNDKPGWGESYANSEASVIAGNTFDYPYVHGESIKKLGYSFVSVSLQTLETGQIDLKDYKFVDLIMGNQKTTLRQRKLEDSLKGIRFEVFPTKLQSIIEKYTKNGGNLFISGSYIGSDLINKNTGDSTKLKFASKILHYSPGSGHAAKNGNVNSVDKTFMSGNIKFNTALSEKIYAATAPDEIEPNKESNTIFRYSENNFSAGTAYKGSYGVIAFGFPFETIIDQKSRDKVMKSIFNYFDLIK